MTSAQPKNSGREQWLESALRTLEQGTVSDISVEQLSRNLGIAKSSFYWHFKDRSSFLDELLGYWTEHYTTYITSDENLLVSPSKAALEYVIREIRERDIMRYDLAIRAWAQIDAEVMKHVKFVYQQRLNFIRHIFSSLGFEGSNLDARVHMFVTYFSWQPYMLGEAFNEQSAERDQHILSLLLADS